MDLETPTATVMYPIVAMFHVLVFVAFVGLGRIKSRYIDRGGCCCFCLYPRPINLKLKEESATESGAATTEMPTL